MMQPGFEVLRGSVPAERRRWEDLWLAWSRREVFAHPAYLDLWTRSGDVPIAGTAFVDGIHVLYPAIMRPIPSELSSSMSPGSVDLTTPYGYGGPYFWGSGDVNQAAAFYWDRWLTWSRDVGVVSEFIRFDLHGDRILPFAGPKRRHQSNVVRSLEQGEQALWMDAAHKVRKNVKRARLRGLRFEVDAECRRIEDFHRLYSMTMKRRQASGGYLWDLDWFARLTRSLIGQCVLVHVLSGDSVVSSELVLLSATTAYSFLGGTDEASFEDRPNDLLKWEAFMWGKGAGLEEFVLGGGYGGDDGIFRYKASFAPKGVLPFVVGARILDRGAYETLSTRAEHQRGAPARADFFPAYRA
jgi:hypothetical protein